MERQVTNHVPHHLRENIPTPPHCRGRRAAGAALQLRPAGQRLVAPAPLCPTITAEGNWTILSATGVYAGLRGQGQATIATLFVPNPGGFLEPFVHSELQGQGHFH